MKTSFVTLIALLLFTGTYAQLATDPPAEKQKGKKHKREKPAKPPVFYIETSTGVNNPSGLLGLDFNVCLASCVTLDAGIGTSTWGNKLFLGSKYYLKSPQRGFAFGGGFTFNSGQENRQVNTETVNGKAPVSVSFKSQPNAFLAAYHYWTLGRRYNRFYTMLGWSVPMHSPHIAQVSGPAITQSGRDHLERRAPGGLIVGFGFSFSLHHM